MRPASTSRPGDRSGLPPRLAAAAAPLRPVALGAAVGLLSALVLAALTVLHLVVMPSEAWHLELLGQYLRGYHVTPAGVLIGAAWAGAVGFLAGALLAVARNAAVRFWLDVMRTRANLEKSEFLDDI